REGGIAVALITGREGPIVAMRAAELGISLVLQGVRDKAQAIAELAQEEGCTLDQVGFMGDDILDLAAMQREGFAASVPNAPPYITQTAHSHASRDDGYGGAWARWELFTPVQGRERRYVPI